MSKRTNKDWLDFLLSYLAGRAEGPRGMSDIDLMHRNLKEHPDYSQTRQQFLHGASDRVTTAMLDRTMSGA